MANVEPHSDRTPVTAATDPCHICVWCMSYETESGSYYCSEECEYNAGDFGRDPIKGRPEFERI